jgi:hypothetical protein
MAFQKVQIHPHTPNGSGVIVIAIWGGVSGLDRLAVETNWNLKATCNRILGEL